QRQRQQTMLAQSRKDRRRRDEWIPVHVAAGPAPELEWGALETEAEAALELHHDARRGVEEHRLEEVERPPHLLAHVRLDPADLVGLPPDRQRLADLVVQLTDARGPETASVE